MNELGGSLREEEEDVKGKLGIGLTVFFMGWSSSSIAIRPEKRGFLCTANYSFCITVLYLYSTVSFLSLYMEMIW